MFNWFFICINFAQGFSARPQAPDSVPVASRAMNRSGGGWSKCASRATYPVLLPTVEEGASWFKRMHDMSRTRPSGSRAARGEE
jgi:hypothetical protein